MCLSKPVIQSKFCVRGFTIYNYKNYFYPIQVNSSRPNIMQLLKGNLRHSWSKTPYANTFFRIGFRNKITYKAMKTEKTLRERHSTWRCDDSSSSSASPPCGFDVYGVAVTTERRSSTSMSKLMRNLKGSDDPYDEQQLNSWKTEKRQKYYLLVLCFPGNNRYSISQRNVVKMKRSRARAPMKNW